MKPTLILTFTALLTSSFTLSEKEKYVGKWIWVKSVLESRAGVFVSTPETENRTESIEISADFIIKMTHNNIVTCEESFSKPKSEDNYTHSKNCSSGYLQIVNDTLQSHRYLSCPSETSYYVKSMD